MLNINHYLVHRQLQTLGHSLNDTHICLMRHHPIDVILAQAIAFGNKGTVVAHICHSITEHRTTLLIAVVHTMINGEVTGRTNRTTRLHMKEGKSLTIGTQIRIHQTDVLLLSTLKHYCCCTVTKERTSITILIVCCRRHFVSTNQDNSLITTALNH